MHWTNETHWDAHASEYAILTTNRVQLPGARGLRWCGVCDGRLELLTNCIKVGTKTGRKSCFKSTIKNGNIRM
jgi:hypothetical protein